VGITNIVGIFTKMEEAWVGWIMLESHRWSQQLLSFLPWYRVQCQSIITFLLAKADLLEEHVNTWGHCGECVIEK
jgi:hypothetical protein